MDSASVRHPPSAPPLCASEWKWPTYSASRGTREVRSAPSDRSHTSRNRRILCTQTQSPNRSCDHYPGKFPYAHTCVQQNFRTIIKNPLSPLRPNSASPSHPPFARNWTGLELLAPQRAIARGIDFAPHFFPPPSAQPPHPAIAFPIRAGHPRNVLAAASDQVRRPPRPHAPTPPHRKPRPTPAPRSATE